MTEATDRRIRLLRAEARRAGDYLQVAICNLALGATLAGEPVEEGEDYSGSGWPLEDVARMTAMTEDEAEAECLRVLAENAAP